MKEQKATRKVLIGATQCHTSQTHKQTLIISYICRKKVISRKKS